MLKKYIQTICFSLATMGVTFFAANAYCVTVGQPQLDAQTTISNAPTSNAVVSVASENVLSTTSAQVTATNAAGSKQTPLSASNQNADREVFRNTENTSK